MPTCRKCDKFMKKGWTRVKMCPESGDNPNAVNENDEYECKGGCVEPEEEEQPSTPDDGTAEYDEDEPTKVKLVTEIEEIINDTIMKDPLICKMMAKNHILELIVDEVLRPCKERVNNKYYVEIASVIGKL